MDWKNMKYCQSCSMPMMPGTQYGTEADGSPSADYCDHCYQGGRFVGDMTMEQMIDFCAPFMAKGWPGMTEEGAKEKMRQVFPQLKRWKK